MEYEKPEDWKLNITRFGNQTKTLQKHESFSEQIPNTFHSFSDISKIKSNKVSTSHKPLKERLDKKPFTFTKSFTKEYFKPLQHS